MTGHTGATTTAGMSFMDLPADIRCLVSNGLVIQPPAEARDAADDEEDKGVNTSTHRNAAMRLNRFMSSAQAAKFPRMATLFNGTPEVPCWN